MVISAIIFLSFLIYFIWCKCSGDKRKKIYSVGLPALLALSTTYLVPIVVIGVLVVALIIVLIVRAVKSSKNEPVAIHPVEQQKKTDDVLSDDNANKQVAPVEQAENADVQDDERKVIYVQSEPVTDEEYVHPSSEQTEPVEEEQKAEDVQTEDTQDNVAVQQTIITEDEEDEYGPAPVEYFITSDEPINYEDEYDGPYECVAGDALPEGASLADEQLSITDDTGEVSEVLRGVDKVKNIAYVVRYRKSFQARLIQSWDDSKAYYTELKNEILSYKKVKSRVSWNYDCFTYNGNTVIKIDVRGKTLCIYYPLDPDDYQNTKYKVERSQIKKCEDVPCLYRIKNPTRLSNAKELIAKVMEKASAERSQRTRRDSYEFPYESLPALVEKGLAKEYIVKEVYDEFIEKSNTAKEQAAENEKRNKMRADQAKVVKMRRKEVEANEVDQLLSDDMAAELVEDERAAARTYSKKDIINVDTISANYEDGEIVNLESLKQKGLLAQNVDYVKVLARGMITKPLTVEAQDFSLEAIKMIILTGGAAVKV
jgi:ribosomal protein L15